VSDSARATDRTYRVCVSPQPALANGAALLADIAALGISGVTSAVRSELYFLRGALDDADVQVLCDELLVDPIAQTATWGLVGESTAETHNALIEVGLLPGVTDSVADNLLARAALVGVGGLAAASAARSYALDGDVSADDLRGIAERLLCNQVIEYYALGRLTPHVGDAHALAELRAETVPVRGLSCEALQALSRDRLLSLDLNEMLAIRAYFDREGRDPTDVELECLAQTWSEHCVHKTFKALVDYVERDDDGVMHRESIDGLIKTYLRAATRAIDAPWVLSAFVDNAGIVAFGDDHEVSFKVETHNHPSALEPFGGANTGVGGVVRDVMGVSARPIANTDVLCFGPLDLDPAHLPTGVLHPQRIYSGVVAGIEDYGNKMGIPTVNGAIWFDRGYTANPLVYCGCVGIAPRGAHPAGAQPGDLVVVIGGRTGRDGLHGATFSSLELTDETGELTGGAVQIGNPITEKITLDAMLVARDERLYNAITDCGAGGLSSAVSEMGAETGVEVDLATVPLKYAGLQPWEIWLSEAQERMVLAVPPAHREQLEDICALYGVEMTVIGRYVDSGRLSLTYGQTQVAELSMSFLHDGLPRRRLRGEWQTPVWAPADVAHAESRLKDATLAMLAHPNVRSKEDVVRRYDHEVQGATQIKPFVGVRADGPSDAAVLKPLEVRDAGLGIALGNGFNPAYGKLDPYAMAVSAIDEAVRNVVAVGADPERIAILDNFCWGNPALPDRMGSLVRACKGCYDGALHYGTPYISGKDSLNNEYLDTVTGKQVAIPPSLLISALGIVPDTERCVTMDLKAPGNLLYLLGETRRELGGSLWLQVTGGSGGTPPGAAPQGPALARALHAAIAGRLVAACHDLSEGGLAVAAAEMALGGRLGLAIDLPRVPTDAQAGLTPAELLVAESNGRYLVEVAPEQAAAFEAALVGLPCARVGRVVSSPTVRFAAQEDGAPLLELSLDEIASAWRGHIDG
jgi:phosphoribosylformylglycinamidine synthase II